MWSPLEGWKDLERRKGREGKGMEGKGREGKEREGKGREGKEREGKGRGKGTRTYISRPQKT